jgi:hypothetical protein
MFPSKWRRLFAGGGTKMASAVRWRSSQNGFGCSLENGDGCSPAFHRKWDRLFARFSTKMAMAVRRGFPSEMATAVRRGRVTGCAKSKSTRLFAEDRRSIAAPEGENGRFSPFPLS